MKSHTLPLMIISAALNSWWLVSPAQAAPPGGDYFSSTSVNTTPTNGPHLTNTQETVAKWFEQFDRIVVTHIPSVTERTILKEPFHQEAERVKRWTETAAKVANNYRDMVTQLKLLPIPVSAPSLKDYRDLTVDWYGDAASIYEDMIKPRQPAKTIEELQGDLAELNERSQLLAKQTPDLRSMDQKIRGQYHVHKALRDDALRQYTTRNDINK